MSVCLRVFACACRESQCLGQSESLGAFLNGQQQHMSKLLVALIGWKVQLVKAADGEKKKTSLAHNPVHSKNTCPVCGPVVVMKLPGVSRR